MPATYEPIATTTLGSASGTITFSSIASSWTDLRIVLNPPAVSASGTVRITFNNDTTTNYSRTTLNGDGATATSGRTSSAANITLGNAVDSANPSLFIVDVFSYAGSTNKTVLAEISNDRNGAGFTSRIVGLWRSTAAITRFDLTHNGGTFNIGTTATLYGIKNA